MMKTYERLHWVYSSRRITVLHGKKACNRQQTWQLGQKGLHLEPQAGSRKSKLKTVRVFKLRACSQWHTSFNKATHPKPTQTADQVSEHLIEWWTQLIQNTTGVCYRCLLPSLKVEFSSWVLQVEGENWPPQAVLWHQCMHAYTNKYYNTNTYLVGKWSSGVGHLLCMGEVLGSILST